MEMKSKNNNGSVKKTVLFLLLLVLIGIVVVIIDYNRAINFSNSNNDEKVLFEISEGESVNQILQSLTDQDLLASRKNMYYTKFYLKINDLGHKLQAGVYEIPKNLTIVELIDSLQLGKAQEIWVTIPEGLRKDEIADIISEELNKDGNSNFSKDNFLKLSNDKEFISSLGLTVEVDNLEGFLFPDKYSFPREITTEQVILNLVNNFINKVGKEYTYQDIIFASIVEREGYNGNDRPIIAGIIIKRFEEGWLLQTDATLLYPVKDWKHVITQADKAEENPYNTYKKIGLPPTPICNPGLQSIKAVWDPEETKYYYYIHDDDKQAHYAATLEEHNQNVNKYLR